MILMQPSLNRDVLDRMQYLVGSSEVVIRLPGTPAKEPFAEDICDFLNDLSKTLMKDPRSRAYSDVITLGFWLRKTSVQILKDKYGFQDKDIHLGRGVAFHIAPSNVPVNFAYSLAAGLLMGNSNVVRVPSKDFPQVIIIAEAIKNALDNHESIRPYIVLVRYNRDKDINDNLSSIADMRIVWGGDQTISELRKSELPPRSNEVTFADRYSLAIIDADKYLNIENKSAVAQDFYNDTYFTDQNACTSPRIVVWVGDNKNEAKEQFWDELHKLVEQKYTFQAITGINKLTSSYLVAVNEPGTKIAKHSDNLVIRANIPFITEQLMNLKDNCGYFFEYDCVDILDLKPLCYDKRCQTIGLLGNKDILLPLLKSGIKGIDRIVPIGKTMDFDLIWDGYNLPLLLTRTIKL